ncbi:MAG: D,D-dipeptide ABC transporter permease, partial [Nonomuraea sp.]|nr:D,D-dipeptide ABC transporter permease [Nonomuraea sp.]
MTRKGLLGRLPEAWRQPLAVAGAVLAVAWVVIALAAPWLAPH